MNKVVVAGIVLVVLSMSGCASVYKTIGIASVKTTDARFNEMESTLQDLMAMTSEIRRLQVRINELSAMKGQVDELSAFGKQVQALSSEIAVVLQAKGDFDADIEDLRTRIRELPRESLKQLVQLLTEALAETAVGQ
jgi:outer membrane murein-binding lipoprotein Lpp